MSEPWPDNLILKVGIDSIIRLKKMVKSEAVKWLSVTYPELRESEVALCLDLAKEELNHLSFDPSTPYLEALKVHRTRALFCAAAWIAGASWGQLGSMFDITRQSVMASSGKLLPADRSAVRLSQEQISLERLAAWYNWYMESLRMLEISGMSVKDVATRFLTITDD